MPALKRRLRVEDVVSLYLRVGRTQALVSAAALIAVIAVIDWGLDPNYSLGFLYFFPILLAARYLTAWEMLPLALLCAVLREDLGSYPWQPYYNVRILVVMFVYLGAGLTVAELARNRQLVIDQLREIADKDRLRQEAEEQLSVLIESSPAAILTIDSDGKILLANEASHRMLGMGREGRPPSSSTPRTTSATARR
ncbi:MAG: PAS domain S-box protein [Acidobacteria bacterium]|nr:PAS domain S-box protein [Acidobacteriota bacterium]